MLQQDEPDDYVIATGETHTVREFLDEACGHLGLDWEAARRDRRALLAPGRGRRAAAATRRRRARSSAGSRRSRSRSSSRIMVDADVKALEDELAGRNVRLVEP